MIIVAWLTSKLGALGAKIAAGAAVVGAIMLAIWRMKASARREGRDIERRRQQDAWSQTEARVAAAGAAADARSDDDVRERLRQRAAAAAGSRDPVQRR